MSVQTRLLEYKAKLMGGLALPAGAVTGKVLTSDGEGNATWGGIQNPILNPSFEYDVVGAAPAVWENPITSGATGEAFAVSEFWAASGKKSLHVKAKNPNEAALKYAEVQSPPSAMIAVVPGQVWTAQSVLNVIAASAAGFQFAFRWYKANKVTQISEYAGALIFPGETGVKTLTQTSTAAPAEAAFLQLVLYESSAVANASHEYYVDDIIAAPFSTVPPYFDGDNGYAEWEGTPGNSVSLAGASRTQEIKKEAVTLGKLAAAVSKQLPAEHGRSAEMVAGKITITAPGVTATGAIIVSVEGTVALAGIVTVTARKAGENFTVESSLVTSTDRVNWAVWKE